MLWLLARHFLSAMSRAVQWATYNVDDISPGQTGQTGQAVHIPALHQNCQRL